ncbi:MAG: DUF1667 domain-containing protein [Treponema sp.]|nr:DUF1667 domain-containing protein [Treponema sp.]
MKTDITCIVCPNGCALHVEQSGGSIVVSGNMCMRGKDFAVAEITAPMRTICSTVRTLFKDVPVLPVRVSSDIPKGKIFDVMREINKITVTEKIGTGETVIKNVCNLGVDVIATSNVLCGYGDEYGAGKAAMKL